MFVPHIALPSTRVYQGMLASGKEVKRLSLGDSMKFNFPDGHSLALVLDFVNPQPKRVYYGITFEYNNASFRFKTDSPFGTFKVPYKIGYDYLDIGNHGNIQRSAKDGFCNRVIIRCGEREAVLTLKGIEPGEKALVTAQCEDSDVNIQYNIAA